MEDKIVDNLKPLDTYEWEGMHIDAECPSVGIPVTNEGSQKLAQYVLILSEEVRRLRIKCNEEVWNS